MEEKKLIEFRNIVKSFDGQIVLKGVNLDIYENEFVTLLGPSGCGKTTLLRILGGFLDADEGSVIFDGEEISKKPPYERELNTVFQKYALFPHLSVYENIAFGLKIKKMSKDVIDQKVMKMLKLIGLEGYEDKNTTLLSGGQQQRVAIARALVNEPKVLLLDEPLAALDLKLRKEMQYELKRIQQEVGITFMFVTLLGPSGCGKTTLLRIPGGFLDAEEGSVIFDGEEISKKPPYERELNTVFQKYALFPHLSVYENIAFGLKIKKMSKDVIDQKVMKMLKLIGLEGYEDKNTTLLSGGQQQRVAIARALVNEPKVLLLDEPLAALDLKLRKEMQYELKRIQQEVGITFIFVTHDQEEALTMSDKIVVMKNGEIQQVGTPQDIYNEPANRYVANFIGESNIIPAVMLEDYKVRFDDITFDCVDFGFKENEPVDVVIRPEDIDIVDVKDGKMTGEVLSVLFKGVHYEIMVETVPGTSVTVNMRVIRNQDVTSEDGKEKISASDFFVDIDDVEELNDKEIIALSNAQAWDPQSDEFISIAKVEYDLSREEGAYPVVFSTANGTSVERIIHVVDQPFVKNEKANEGVMAFNFFKTVDEITESQALDTDLKTWAGAQGWKLSDEDVSIDLSVDYDFEPEDVKEGVYRITFSTTGREFKIHTTDYVEEGREVGLTFFPKDIHVMSREVF